MLQLRTQIKIRIGLLSTRCSPPSLSSIRKMECHELSRLYTQSRIKPTHAPRNNAGELNPMQRTTPPSNASVIRLAMYMHSPNCTSCTFVLHPMISHLSLLRRHSQIRLLHRKRQIPFTEGLVIVRRAHCLVQAETVRLTISLCVLCCSRS